MFLIANVFPAISQIFRLHQDIHNFAGELFTPKLGTNRLL